jgi:hypothetical protein
MSWFRRLFETDDSSNRDKRRAQRAAEIGNLGLRLVDESGWHDGQFAQRRYFLVRDEQVVAGPFASSREALTHARRL